MTKFKSLILKLSLLLIILLIFLSIAGAFLGAQRAKTLFNSLPLKVFWALWLFVLIASLLFFPKIRKIPALFAIHFGILLIILGSILSSQTGYNILQNKILSKFTNTKKIPRANMIIFEGQKENRVIIMPDEKIEKLPFYVKLNDFRITYYEPGEMIVITPDKHIYTTPAKINNKIRIRHYGTLKITKVFRNFKIHFENGNPIAIDSKNSGDNPAIEIRHTQPDGKNKTYYIFSRYPEFSKAPKNFTIIYHKQIKDYISNVSIIKNGKIILSKAIRVNHPLHFEGYHFYQISYDEKNEKYTVLLVVSDSGITIVWTGYILLGFGIIWLFYGNAIVSFIKNRNNERYDNQI